MPSIISGRCSDLSLKNMINQDWVWGGFMDDMLLVNRRIANLLTVTTLYIDQIPCDLCRIFGDTASAGVEFKAARLVGSRRIAWNSA